MAVIDTYELSDRFRRDDGRVFLSGSQALARLPYEQLRADRRAGLHTAAYVSGYPGSPLGGYDRDVAAAAKLAEAEGLRMVFQPGMNEELAATAVMGTQLAVTLDSCRYDGVLGIWYGKAPGLDRASDALRHAVFAGTSPKGGAIALVGDDPMAKSSTLPSSSGATLVDLHMPIIYPGDVQEAIDLGRHAIAMSRSCGVWVGMKVIDSLADGTGSVELHPERITPVLPVHEIDGRPWVPHPDGRIITPYTVELEREFHEVRLVLAREYGVLNRLNTVAVRGPSDWVGIVSPGYTYLQTREALALLGFRSDDDLRAAGIRLFKAAMPVPLDVGQVREFAEGLQEVIVVEEKAPNLEWIVKDALFGRADHPVVVGRRDDRDDTLFPITGALDADAIALRLRQRLTPRLSARMTPEPPPARTLIPLAVNRSPFFCSGCPHNSSTRVPEGMLVGAGIGCHSMVMLMEPERTGTIVGITAMGNEGAQWFGIAPFVDEPHLVQNLGDGTLFHSGFGAIRAAVANGANITYKILYNGAVSMTGGQDPQAQLGVLPLCKALLAVGVQRIIITTDDLSRYHAEDLPTNVKAWGRSRLIEAQRALAEVPGCTVLIHDQRCAAELRRDRKRNRIAAPDFRVVINERVCEGCGDCGDQSGCLSVQPVDTAFGRKTRIDQDSCNFDLSCMKGDCPAFMTVRGGGRAKADRVALPSGSLPDPAVGMRDCTVRMTGIGGTGVVTVSQVLGTAAMLQGYHVRGLDQTGLSQKAGPVVSDVRLAVEEPVSSNRAPNGSADVLLAFDQLVGGSDSALRVATDDRTVVVADTAVVPTGSMVLHPEQVFPGEAVATRIATRSRDRLDAPARHLARRLLGDDSTANVLLLGAAVQAGHVPVDPAQVARAIELNGVAVEKNLAAFAWGRWWVADREAVLAASGEDRRATVDEPVVERLTADLRDYQSDAYAARFTEVVDEVAAHGHAALTEAVARNLHKLMAYKDEYEVARLLLLPSTTAQAESVAGKGAKVTWHLHPPMFRAMGMRRKMKLGRWSRPAMRILRASRRLRGTPLDLFGVAKVRRLERAMIPEYVAAVRAILPHVTAANLDEAVAIASLPDQVRGYERLKEERAATYRAELAARVAAFTA